MKKKLINLLKMTLSGLILYLIFRRIDLGEVIRIAANIRVSTFVLLIITSLLKLVTQYSNWDYCLRINKGYVPDKKDVIRTLFIGSALRFLAPGGSATFGKAYFLNHSKRKTFISVAMEKFMLTWSIWLFGSWAAMYYFRQYPLWIRLAVTVTVTLLPLIIYSARRVLPFYAEYFDKCLQIVPIMLLNQLVYVLFTVFQYVLIINGFLCFPLIRALVGVPLILTANTIPITFSGLGLRETFAMNILPEYGISAEIAVMSSLLIFLINAVIPALIGAVLISGGTVKKKSD